MEKNSAIEIYKEVLSAKRKRFPGGFWYDGEIYNYETAKEIVTYLIEEKLKWNDEQLKKRLRVQTFREYKLYGMLGVLFHNSPYEAINNAYPGKFHEWDFEYAPKNYWNLETAKKATIWLVEEKLKMDRRKIRSCLSKRHFYENGIGGMLSQVFNNNVCKAVINAYGVIKN